MGKVIYPTLNTLRQLRELYFEVSVSSWAASDVFDYSAVVTNDGPAPIVPQNVTANAVGADIVVAWEPAPSPDEVAIAANNVTV